MPPYLFWSYWSPPPPTTRKRNKAGAGWEGRPSTEEKIDSVFHKVAESSSMIYEEELAVFEGVEIVR